MRRLHKAFLRWHDPDNWPMLRAALKRMGRADLIGNGKHQLIPAYQPAGTGKTPEGARRKHTPFRTQHTGLPHTPPLPGKRHSAALSRRPSATLHPGSPTGRGRRG